MSAIILSGSPHKIGASETFARAKFPAAEIVRLYESAVAPCRACGLCETNAGCAIKDDFQAILDKIAPCATVVLAFPLYFDSFPAPMKAFVDRLHSIYSASFAVGKKIPVTKEGFVFITCGSDRFDAPSRRTLSHILATLGASLEQVYIKSGTDKI